MLNFQSDDWTYVKSEIEKLLANHRRALEQDQTYKEVIASRAKIEILKTLLNLPEAVARLPATKR